MSDGTVACTRPPAGWTCSRGDGHEGPCAARHATAQSLSDEMMYEVPGKRLHELREAEAKLVTAPLSLTDMDVRRLADFLRQEFPNAVSRTPGTEVVVDTAMVIMAEMKIVLDAQGAAPEEGW